MTAIPKGKLNPLQAKELGQDIRHHHEDKLPLSSFPIKQSVHVVGADLDQPFRKRADKADIMKPVGRSSETLAQDNRG